MYDKKREYERIGCDRIALVDVDVTSININTLEQHENVKISYGGQKSINVCGVEFSKLEIKDEKVFQCFKISMLKGYGKEKENIYLSVTVSEMKTNNLVNVNLSDMYNYLNRIVKPYLMHEYGIVIELSDARICILEMNITFHLEMGYEEYKRALHFFIDLMPHDMGTEMSAKRNDKAESLLKKNRQRSFKIYNKTAEMKVKGEEPEDDKDVLRMEYTLQNCQKVREAFGTDYITEIEDVQIVKYFWTMFQKDFDENYVKWRVDNENQLTVIMEENKKKNKWTWQRDTLSECRNYEQDHHEPLLLDIEDLLCVVKKCDVYGHYKRTEMTLLKKCVEDDVFLRKEHDKIREIFEKTEAIYIKQVLI